MLATGLPAASGPDPIAVGGATDEAEYAALWNAFGLQSAAPSVDFEREIVLYLGMAGSSSCPEQFRRLVVDHQASRVYAQWQQPGVGPGRGCTDDLAPQGVLVAVSRAELPEQPFSLSLRGQPLCPDCPDQPDQAIIDPR